MPAITFREIAHNSPDYGQAVALRSAILRLPLGLSFSREELQSEASCLHLGGFLQAELIACLVLQPLDGKTMRMRQVAVKPELRGQGIGRMLVHASEAFAGERGLQQLTLHARESVVGFYERLGYGRIGACFVEVTLPHWAMSKTLVPTSP
jgi:predicted GNAT family N-acyltransferase